MSVFGFSFSWLLGWGRLNCRKRFESGLFGGSNKKESLLFAGGWLPYMIFGSCPINGHSKPTRPQLYIRLSARKSSPRSSCLILSGFLTSHSTPLYTAVLCCCFFVEKSRSFSSFPGCFRFLGRGLIRSPCVNRIILSSYPFHPATSRA